MRQSLKWEQRRENKKPLTNSEELYKWLGGTTNLHNFSDMAYNKRNLYLKVIEIQDKVLAGQKRGDTQKEIFFNEIESVYHISMATFYNYLNMPAKLKLEKLEKELAEKRAKKEKADAAKRAQLSLVF